MAETDNLTQEEISRSVSKSRPYIANSLRLLKLPDSIKSYVSSGELTPGHARAILAAPGSKQEEIARRIIKDGLTVRAAEKLAAEKAASEKAAAEKLASEKAAAEKQAKPVAKSAPAAPLPAEANAAPDDRRDANDLARAAIERLRNAKSSEKSAEQPRAPEAARAEEQQPARVQERARVNSVVYAPAAAPQQPSVQPLPPAVTVAPGPSEAAVTAPPKPFPEPISGSSADDGLRLTPPADIPSRPLDLRAKQGRFSSVTDDVVSAAKSVFHAVVPESN